MPGFGFGHASSRRAGFAVGGATVGEAVTQHGVTFNFGSPRPVGQYANGDWWVLGPVTITSISPTSMVQASGTDGNGNAYTNRVVHGTMVNPGNRAFAPDGLAANNPTNMLQSFDTLANGVSNMVYNAANNVDPGATGQALVVTSGSVMKFVSRLTDLPSNNRPAGTDMVVLTAVQAIPAPDAVRPGVSRAGDKPSPCRMADFDLDVFQNLTPTASAPDFPTALSWVNRYIETTYPDCINNTGAKGINNHPEYGREIANNIHSALLCLHLASFSSEEKRKLLACMASIADDLVSRAEEGGITPDNGGGNAWKLPVIVVCAAALGVKTPATWMSCLSTAQRLIWMENRQIFTVTGADVAQPRMTSDGRARSPFTQQMLGSSDWGAAATSMPTSNGSNWDLSYRDIVSYSLYPGILAVELTTGAKALWDNPSFWLYMDTVFLRRNEGSAGNKMLAFPLEMTNAYRPAKLSPPAIVDTGIKDSAIWVRFDQALNEIATLPPLADFVVRVNGTPVTISSRSIWRQNLGLSLAAPVAGADTVTLDYMGTTNRVRSVDGVSIADIVNRSLVNRTDKVGGPNAAYPVVRFSPGVQRTIGGSFSLAPAHNALGTMALLKFRFGALPSATQEIFGNPSGGPALRMFVWPNGAMELRIANETGVSNVRAFFGAMVPNTTYDILISVDMTQATIGAGLNAYINGVPQTLSTTMWGGGPGTVAGWGRGASYRWNFTNTWTFELGAFWLDATTRVDLTNAANRAKFTSVTGGNLNILTRGEGITGSVPAQFLVGNADQWNDGLGINRGSGNRFFVTSGLVTGVAGSEWI